MGRGVISLGWAYPEADPVFPSRPGVNRVFKNIHPREERAFSSHVLGFLFRFTVPLFI